MVVKRARVSGRRGDPDGWARLARGARQPRPLGLAQWVAALIPSARVAGPARSKASARTHHRHRRRAPGCAPNTASGPRPGPCRLCGAAGSAAAAAPPARATACAAALALPHECPLRIVEQPIQWQMAMTHGLLDTLPEKQRRFPRQQELPAAPLLLRPPAFAMPSPNLSCPALP